MVPLEDKVKWAEREDKNQNPLEFFRKHYNSGTTRGQLAREDFSLYRILRRRDLLDDAIPNFDTEAFKKGKSAGRKSRFGNNPVAYYKGYYDGLTRTQLQKQDRSLYERLREDGLLWHVPTKGYKGK